MSKKDSIFIYLAVWGAVISTISLLWNIIVQFNNRSKLSIRCFPDTTISEIGLHNNARVIRFEISNIGNKPINIEKIRVTLDNNQNRILKDSPFPKMLNAKEMIKINFPLEFINNNIREMGVIDSEQKYWRVKKKFARVVFKTVNKL